MGTLGHIPVLRDEVINLLDPRPGEFAVDCTAGLGGHAIELARRIGPTGSLVLIDLDRGNLEASRARIESLSIVERPLRIHVRHGSFADVARIVIGLGWGTASVVLADLGFASSQMDDPKRGFSFSRDGPLDMRLNPESEVSAAELVNTLSERELAEGIAQFGEEPFPSALGIARKVVHARTASPITTTGRLAEVVRSAVPPRRPGQKSHHPATRTFQALRIMVNDELGSLDALLSAVRREAMATTALAHTAVGRGQWLASGSRIGIISFHSLEDRRVKRAFASLEETGTGTNLARKPVEASESEVAINPRSRSAKLRVFRIVPRVGGSSPN